MIGYTDEIHIARADCLMFFILIECGLGSIGFGKSKFLEYQMRQDLAARQPFCLIAFHGTLFQKIKVWCAFNAYYDRRIVLIDPVNGNTAKGFNPFRKKPGSDVGVQTSGMIEAMLRVWGLSSADSYPVIYKLTKVLFTCRDILPPS
ncbi:MAG: hypothetical protein V7641_3835 [Blastocatellia bacterium]